MQLTRGIMKERSLNTLLFTMLGRRLTCGQMRWILLFLWWAGRLLPRGLGR